MHPTLGWEYCYGKLRAGTYCKHREVLQLGIPGAMQRSTASIIRYSYVVGYRKEGFSSDKELAKFLSKEELSMDTSPDVPAVAGKITYLPELLSREIKQSKENSETLGLLAIYFPFSEETEEIEKVLSLKEKVLSLKKSSLCAPAQEKKKPIYLSNICKLTVDWLSLDRTQT